MRNPRVTASLRAIDLIYIARLFKVVAVYILGSIAILLMIWWAIIEERKIDRLDR